MDDKQAMHAMSIDDAYHVERTLARGPSGVTELVSIDGNGPFVRKKIPSPLAQRNVWAVLSACQSNRLPRVEATYELPDRFVIVYDYVPGQHACANCGGKRAACAECGRTAYRPNLRSRAGASPARRYPPRHHAGQYHPGSGWRASHRFRHCAHMVSVKQSLAGHHGAWHLWFRLARAIWLRQNRRAFRRVLAWSTARIHAGRRISRCQRLRAATCR